MGLDIYLYTAIDAAQNEAHDEASEAFYERPDYDSLGDAEKKAIREAMPPYAPHVGVPSEKYPEHLFNRRYLRSSYNGGGFNHAVPQLLTTSGAKSYPHERGSLYWIFEPMGREWDGDDGRLTHEDIPKLHEAQERALSVVGDLSKSDRLRVMTISPNVFSGPPKHTDDAALAMYRAELPLRTSDGWYSRGPNLNVFGGGLTTLAAIPGKGTFGEPAVHLVYRVADEGFDSYVQSAEIVVEFCDEAIALIERDGGASMSWSG
jgi:hypothetical protein